MNKCPKCKRELIKVHHESDDEMAMESLTGSIVIGNCCENPFNYYCEYCDEFFHL